MSICTRVLLATLAAVGGLAGLPSPAAEPASVKLRVVGGLDGLNQYTRQEVPFWTERLARLSGGRYSAEIVPFDRAGIRGQELLSMVRLGTVPFGTLLVSQASPKDAELAAPDLAGLNPDASSVRRSVEQFRPRMQALLRERHNAELLAVYLYPAQVLFCNQPLPSLEGLRGRRVRTSSVTQSDWVQALGGQPVSTPFAEIVSNMKSGNMDCAITGTMSGHLVGLHEITSHLHTMPVTWGLSVFVAHGPTWRALPDELRQLLARELPRLESAIWEESLRETELGVACNAGSSTCPGGRPGRMTVVRPSAADDELRRRHLRDAVLPAWLQRCGPGCDTRWNELLAPAAGVEARRR